MYSEETYIIEYEDFKYEDVLLEEREPFEAPSNDHRKPINKQQGRKIFRYHMKRLGDPY
jgi:hypothetical protein